METKYYVNGKEFTDKAEAEKAEAKFMAEKAQKEKAAKIRKSMSDELAEAYKNLIIIRNTAIKERKTAINNALETYKETVTKADEAYDNATKDAQEKVDTLLAEFRNRYGNYYLKVSDDGKNPSVTVESEDHLSDIFNDFFDSFNHFIKF